MSTIAVIPARAGSKGIKNKNIIDFCGRPLLAWSILQAKACKKIDAVYVSTDGADIAQIARTYGAEVIWRPEELSSDTATSESALRHAVEQVRRNCQVDTVVFLQATSPIRRAWDLDGALNRFAEGRYDSLFSMAVLDDFCMWKRENGTLDSFSYDYRRRGRRQERDPLYLENGSIYIFRPEILFEYDNRLGGRIGMYEMPFECSFEIDSMQELPVCEYFMRKVMNHHEESVL